MNTTNTKGALVALEPCPFCGSGATKDNFGVWVECSSCEALMTESGNNAHDAVERWNLRAALQAHSPPAPAELDAVIRAAVWDSAEVVHPGRLASETAAGAVTDEQIRAVLDLRVGAMDGIEEVFVRNVRRVLSLATPPAATKVPSRQ